MIVNPKPVQKPLPPFYMATSSLDGVEVGARLGINMFLPIHTRTPEQVVEYANAYWDGLKKHGHDPKSRELGLVGADAFGGDDRRSQSARRKPA